MGEILGVFGIDWRLLLIQGINFGVLLLALWYLLYRPVIAMIEKRREAIEAGVRDAQAAESKLREIDAAEQVRLTKANTEADAIVERAKQHAKEEGELVVAHSREQSERLLSEAKQRAEEERTRAISESREEISRLAILAAEKILREKGGVEPHSQ